MVTRPETRNVSTVLDELAAGVRPSGNETPLRTGYEPLDDALHGGLRAQDLVLVGGKPGVGKTIASLQWARNMALDGADVVFACYEHPVKLLTARLLLLELGGLVRAGRFHDTEELRNDVADLAAGRRSLEDVRDGRGLLSDTLACMHTYADKLWLVSASAQTGLPELEQMVGQHGSGRTALFVDYLQKVALAPEPATEEEKMNRVAGGLKDLALSHDCVAVGVAASTQAGLVAHRQRVHHLRGSSALAYEADVVIMLNEKVDAVSKVHLAYDSVKADRYRRLVVFSVEKNRNGPAGVDVEFEKDFAHARFVSPGHWVAERLSDDRMVAE